MADPTDPFGGLNGEDRDAYLAVTNMLKAYGLESLGPAVLGFIQNGYSADTIGILLQDTPAYKARFKANDARRAAGLPALSPAEYLSLETSYRQVMSSAGLPPGFYDEPSDFDGWISQDVAPVEIQERVKIARDAVDNLDPSSLSQFEQWYSRGDLIAYALDRDRATTVLQRQVRAAQAAGAGANAGLSLSQQQAERISANDLSADQIRQGVGTAAALSAGTKRLGGIYGTDLTDDDIIGEVFESNTGAAERRRRLASQERAAFTGSGGTGDTSLSGRRGGQV